MAKKNFSSEEFERFLFWLDKDREKAGQEYKNIHSSLTKIFYSRGCEIAEELASETLDRVVVACQKIIDTYKGAPIIFCYGVGKNVFLEYTRNPKFDFLDNDTLSNNSENDAKEKELADIEYECLQKCLTELSRDHRDLITTYHSTSSGVEEKKKKKRELEKKFNISYESLRIRAFRIRKNLHKCIEKCKKNS